MLVALDRADSQFHSDRVGNMSSGKAEGPGEPCVLLAPSVGVARGVAELRGVDVVIVRIANPGSVQRLQFKGPAPGSSRSQRSCLAREHLGGPRSILHGARNSWI